MSGNSFGFTVLGSFLDMPGMCRYWAIAVPCWVCVAVVAAFWAYERFVMCTAFVAVATHLVHQNDG